MQDQLPLTAGGTQYLDRDTLVLGLMRILHPVILLLSMAINNSKNRQANKAASKQASQTAGGTA